MNKGNGVRNFSFLLVLIIILFFAFSVGFIYVNKDIEDINEKLNENNWECYEWEIQYECSSFPEKVLYNSTLKERMENYCNKKEVCIKEHVIKEV